MDFRVGGGSGKARSISTLGAGLLVLLGTGRAVAVPCDDVPLPNKVFGAGGSQLTPTLRRVALAIANDPHAVPEEQTTLFYADPSACEGYAAFAAGATTRTFKYWVAGSNPDRTCEARDGGQPLDFAHVQLSAELCGEVITPPDVRAYPATIRSLSLVTGLESEESSISAEALHLIYSRGPLGQVSPWTDGTAIFAPTGYLRELLGLAIRLPPARFHDDYVFSDATRLSLLRQYSTNVTRASQALAFVDTATADVNRANVKVLAYQHFGQSCGVWPDSTPSSFDKLNVRLGKYALWNAGRLFARTPLSARVSNFLGWFDGSAQPFGSEVLPLAELIRAGDIPDCAMQARRDGELGPLSSYAPPKPCHGLFERIANGATDHDACIADADCGEELPRCNFGHCEAYRDAEQSEG